MLVATPLIAGLLALPAAAPCRAELEAQRRAWQAAGPAVAQPAMGDGSAVRHWPTATLGVWLVEQTSPHGASLTRVAAGELERVEWSGGCTAAHDRRPRPTAIEPAFTDATLQALLAGPPGVIYLWSPHLPLSVDGYAHVVAAAARHGLRVEPVLAAGADRGFARAAVDDGRIPSAALRVADAVELEFRDLALHAPAVLVHAGGRLRGPVLPGYRTADEYAVYFARMLDDGKRRAPDGAGGSAQLPVQSDVVRPAAVQTTPTLTRPSGRGCCSLKKMLIGAAVGATLALLPARACDGSNCTSVNVKAALLGAGIGAAIGATLSP